VASLAAHGRYPYTLYRTGADGRPCAPHAILQLSAALDSCEAAAVPFPIECLARVCHRMEPMLQNVDPETVDAIARLLDDRQEFRREDGVALAVGSLTEVATRGKKRDPFVLAPTPWVRLSVHKGGR
jgi:hypothetical protein